MDDLRSKSGRFTTRKPNPDKPEIRNSKIEIRNKSEIPKFKCLKRNYRRDKVDFNSNPCTWLFVIALQRCQQTTYPFAAEDY